MAPPGVSEVHPDRTVTLRLNAPRATEVILNGNITVDKPQVAMTKDDKGIWSVTVGPLEPDVYEYNFVVDGVTTNTTALRYTSARRPGTLLSSVRWKCRATVRCSTMSARFRTAKFA